MSRFFDGSGDNHIICNVGGCAAVGSGAYTLISLFRVPLFGSATGLGGLRRSGAFARYTLVTGAKMFGKDDFSSGFATVPDDTWFWIVQRKAAGAAHYEFAYAEYPVADPDTDITFGEAVDAANHTDPGLGDEVWIGQNDIVARGDQAVHAMFTSRLSDADIKSALTTALVDLMALGPAGCWPLNQAADTDPVLDVTGNGANQLDEDGIVGTVTVSDDPPGYDYSLTVPTIDGVLAGTAPMPTAALTGDARITAILAASLPLPVAALTGDARVDAALAGRAPMPRAALAGDLRIDGVLAGSAPMPTAHLYDTQFADRGTAGLGNRAAASAQAGTRTRPTATGRAR